MAFHDLVRHSKVLSLPSKAVRGKLKAHAPQAQVLETTDASAHRRDWGLKRMAAPCVKTNLLSLESLDNQYDLSEIDYNPRFARKVERMEEIGSALAGEPALQATTGPVAHSAPQKTTAQLSANQLKRLVKKAKLQRKNYLAQDPAIRGRTAQDAENFLGLGSMSTSALLRSPGAATAIGLTYASPQVYFNTPDKGIVDRKVVPGRPVLQGMYKRVAIGGFLANSSSGEGRPLKGDTLLHQSPRDYHVTIVTSAGEGAVQMQVQPVTTAPERRRSDLDDILKV